MGRLSRYISADRIAAYQKSKEEAEEAMEKTPLKKGKYNEDAKSSNKLTRAQLMDLEDPDHNFN